MGNSRGYVHLRTRDGNRSIARVVGEHDATLHLAPGQRTVPLPSQPEPVEVGWMTWAGMVWCGGLVLGEKGFGESVRVRLLGKPVASERRRYVRLPVDLDVEVVPGGYDPTPVRGKCVDLSPGGMQVVLPLELDIGDVVRITLSADDGDSLRTTARVARRIGPSRFGFAFELLVVGSPRRFARFALDQATRQLDDADKAIITSSEA
jgi:hypothetical protein